VARQAVRISSVKSAGVQESERGLPELSIDGVESGLHLGGSFGMCSEELLVFRVQASNERFDQ
jgi:hypothetical protein